MLSIGMAMIAPLMDCVDATAQTLIGTVVEERRGGPVADATLSLVNLQGERRAAVISDSLGRFQLAAPESGEYIIEAARLGYATTRSPLLSLEASGSVAIEITLTAIPIGLAGLEVSVDREAAEMLGSFGLTPAQLGPRWISAGDIEKMPLPPSPREAIRWQNIAGLSIAPDVPSRQRKGPELCVFLRQRGCADIYLDGVRIPPDVALAVNPLDLQGIAILRPIEATTFFGTGAANGVVLMWTRTGGMCSPGTMGSRPFPTSRRACG
jgi:carboxypeptidase family protein